MRGLRSWLQGLWSSCSTNGDGEDNILAYAGRGVAAVAKAPFQILNGIWKFGADLIVRPPIAWQKVRYLGWLGLRAFRSLLGSVDDMMVLIWELLIAWWIGIMAALALAPAHLVVAIIAAPLAIYTVQGTYRVVVECRNCSYEYWCGITYTGTDGVERRNGRLRPAPEPEPEPEPEAEPEPEHEPEPEPEPEPEEEDPQLEPGQNIEDLMKEILKELEARTQANPAASEVPPLATGFRNLEV